MAYAAGLGETRPEYYDTTRPAGPQAHPLFPVCWEWPLVLALREAAGLRGIDARLVHAEHDTVLHRPVRAGDTLAVSATVIAVEQRRPGAFLVARLDAVDGSGAPVATTRMGSLYRGVAVEGGGGVLEAAEPAAVPAGTLDEVAAIEVGATAAHVYTECARIWNPIHTDLAYALAAGLPGLILHGTATLALSVSRVMGAFGVAPRHVRRVACRFSAMVPMPSRLSVHARRDGAAIAFETRNADGAVAISRGVVMVG